MIGTRFHVYLYIAKYFLLVKYKRNIDIFVKHKEWSCLKRNNNVEKMEIPIEKKIDFTNGKKSQKTIA